MNPIRTVVWATTTIGMAGGLLTLGFVSAPSVLLYNRARHIANNPPTLLPLLMGRERSHATVAGIEPTPFQLLGGAKK